MLKKAFVLFTIFIALIVVGCSNGEKSDTSTTVAKADIILVVEEEKENFTVEFEEGSSLMDIMKSNFEIETAFEDSYIIGINGLLANDEAKVGWMYYVDGEFATKGANDFTPEDGDSIEFRYESWE